MGNTKTVKQAKKNYLMIPKFWELVINQESLKPFLPPIDKII
nr:hypothetical protein [Streptococcus intermedius]